MIIHNVVFITVSVIATMCITLLPNKCCLCPVRELFVDCDVSNYIVTVVG